MQKILSNARLRLDAISQGDSYKDLLVKLIVQGLEKLESSGDKEGETSVEVKVRTEDVKVATEALPIAQREYESKSGKRGVTLSLAKDSLPPSPKNAGPKALETCSGGIILSTYSGRIVCNNTLDVRLRYAYDHAVPLIRQQLFAAH